MNDQSKPPAARRRRATPSVDSFAPEMFEALRQGARRRVEVEFKSWSEARNFQFRLNKLKAALREDGHPLWSLVSRARVSLFWGTKAGYAAADETTPRNRTPKSNPPSKIIIQPQDMMFVDALNKAGIEAGSEPITDDPPADAWQDPLDAFVDRE